MRFNSEYRPGARQFIGYAFLFSCHTLHTYTDTHSQSVDRLKKMLSYRIELNLENVVKTREFCLSVFFISN